MADPARRKLTYEDLLAATIPDERTPELIDGELDYKPAPRARHSFGQGEIRGALDPIVRGGGGGGGVAWWILIEPDVRVDRHTVVRPDMGGWRRARLPTLPDGIVEVPPDWICEVLSPGHERRDRVRKMDVYHQLGVPWYWLLHPEERTLEVFELRAGEWVRRGGWTDGDVARIPPFEATEIHVSRLLAPDPGSPLAGEPAPAAYGG